MAPFYTGRGISVLSTVYLVVLILAYTVVHCDARHSSYLDEGKVILLEWETDGETIAFTVTANTTGWIGIGFSPSGGMAGSDIVTGWVTGSGVAIVQDRYAHGKELPHLDKQQDYYNIAGSEKNGHTELKFSRKLRTCDSEDREITADTTRVIYAYGSNDPVGNDPNYHGNFRGSRSAIFIGRMPLFTATNTTSEVISPKVPITIPTDETTYWCSLVEFPKMKAKKHMIKWEPVITPGNEGVVHHMLLLGCYDNKNRSDHVGENASFPCFVSANMPSVMRECGQLIAVWSIGGEATVFPDDVGYAFDEYDHPGYVLIQTHYDNPQRRADIVDQSGLRLTFTSDIRKYDAGTLQSGHSLAGVIIPPGQPDFQVHGFCTGLCTQTAFPTEGINVFGGMLHAHLLGTEMYVRHYRNNTELKPLMVDHLYDFNYQQFRTINPVIKVLKGDTLHTTCHYDSTNRTTVTFGGESTKEEMCLAYILYYPKINLSMCESEPVWTAGEGTLYDQLNINRSNWLSTSYDALYGVDWKNQKNSQIVQNLYNTTDVKTACLRNFQFPHMAAHYKNWTAPSARWNKLPSDSLCLDKKMNPQKNRDFQYRPSSLLVLFGLLLAVLL